MYGDPRSDLGVVGGLADSKGGHRGGEGDKIGSSIRFPGGFVGASSISHGLVVVGNGEWSTIKEEFGEEVGAHTGGNVIIVGGFDWVQNVGTNMFDEEGKEVTMISKKQYNPGL